MWLYWLAIKADTDDMRPTLSVRPIMTSLATRATMNMVPIAIPGLDNGTTTYKRTCQLPSAVLPQVSLAWSSYFRSVGITPSHATAAI